MVANPLAGLGVDENVKAMVGSADGCLWIWDSVMSLVGGLHGVTVGSQGGFRLGRLLS